MIHLLGDLERLRNFKVRNCTQYYNVFNKGLNFFQIF